MFRAADSDTAAAVKVPVRVGEADKTTVLPVPVVLAAEIAVPLPARTGLLIVVSIVIAGVVVAFATVPAKPLVDTTETVVTVPPVPDGAAHVPSALKKFVEPPPEAGAKPLRDEVKTGRIALTCATVKSIGFAVEPVLLPLIVNVAICAALALVTALFAINFV
jgi:hypothetical protein